MGIPPFTALVRLNACRLAGNRDPRTAVAILRAQGTFIMDWHQIVVLEEHVRRMHGTRVAREKQSRLKLPIKGRRLRSARDRQMGRPIKCATDFALPKLLIAKT